MWILFSRTSFLLLHRHQLHYTNCAIRANRPIRVLTTRSLLLFVVSPSLLTLQPLTRCSAVSSRFSAMLRDADPSSFSAIYAVCGYTDMRYGMDTLAAIIETRYHLPLFVPNTLFLFCGRRASKIKGLLWERDGFRLFGPSTVPVGLCMTFVIPCIRSLETPTDTVLFSFCLCISSSASLPGFVLSIVIMTNLSFPESGIFTAFLL